MIAAAIPCVVAWGVFCAVRHMQHEHHAGSVSGDEPERVMYPYINIRNKYAAPSSSRPMRPFLAFPRTNPSTMTNSPRPPPPPFQGSAVEPD